MPVLTPCPACNAHVFEGDATCPHCGERLRATATPRASWLVLSLALAGCPSEDIYGAPDSGDDGDTAQPTETGETAGTDESTGSAETSGSGETEGSETAGG